MELAKHADLLRAQGLGLCAISYDPVEVLRDFAQRRGITYPLLADPHTVIIRRFGLFNEAIPPGDRAYGVPHPALLFVDPSGIVTRKYAEEKYFHRRTFATILAERRSDRWSRSRGTGARRVRDRAALGGPAGRLSGEPVCAYGRCYSSSWRARLRTWGRSRIPASYATGQAAILLRDLAPPLTPQRTTCGGPRRTSTSPSTLPASG